MNPNGTEINPPVQPSNHQPSNKRRKKKKNKRNGDTFAIDGKRFEKIRMLGKGAYGKVFKVKDEEENFYAIKKVEYKEHEGVYPDIIKEMDFLRRFSHHPNVIELCGWKWDNQVFCALMEYGGSPLHRFIADEEFDYRMELLPEVLWQVLNGLTYLHSKNVVHRDIKPDNILIDEWIVERERIHSLDGQELDEHYSPTNSPTSTPTRTPTRTPSPQRSPNRTSSDASDTESSSSTIEESIEINVRLVDFGLSKTLSVRRNTPKTSTLWYRAPENLAQLKEYGCKIDVWALGCIIYEYYTGEVLFRGNVTKDTLIRVLSTFGPNIPDRVYRRLKLNKDKLPKKWKKYRMKRIEDDLLRDLMMQCLTLHPDDRPDARTLLEHEYFKKHGYSFDEASITRIDENAYDPQDNLREVPLTTQTDEWIPLTRELHTEIVDWMFHISSVKYVEVEYETTFLGIQIFERVIRKWKDPINNIAEYKYIALACLDIASKCFEIYSIELEWIYEYNNKEYFKEIRKKYEADPLSFKSPPRKPVINKGDLRAFVVRINRYEQKILYLLDFYVYTKSVLETLKDEYPDKDKKVLVDMAKKQVYENIV